MFRLRSKSGDESVFRTPEEIRSALLSGFVTPDAQIWDAALKGWVPLLEHPLYQQIAAAPPGRKSSSVKSPPSGSTKVMPPATPPASSPTTAKPVQKLVIRRPGEGAAPAAPAAPATPPAPPATPTRPAAEEVPELEMIDVDLSMDEEPIAAPAPTPAPVAPTPPPAPPRRPTPPPAPVAEVPAPAPRPSTPRVSTPRVTAPREVPDEGRPVMQSMQSMESMGSGGSKKGIVIGAVVVLLAAGGAFFGLRGKLGGSSAGPDSTVTPRVAVVDSAPDTTLTAAPDTTTPAPAAAAPVDTAPVAAPPPVIAAAPVVSAPDTTPIGPAVPPVPFAPNVERGAASWNSRAPGSPALSIPELESVRLRYIAAQGRALEQFEAGLQASGFADMFAPSKVANQDRRSEALDAVDAARSALNEFRRRQVAIDFAYRDTLRAALPAGSDEPDLRTFGPLLRENPAQAALTDSLIAEMAEIYGTLVRDGGNYALRGRDVVFKQQPTADRYREQQERLTAQMARIRRQSPSEVPPAMAGVLRGIGLPR
jgi:hypothetical protein